MQRPMLTSLISKARSYFLFYTSLDFEGAVRDIQSVRPQNKHKLVETTSWPDSMFFCLLEISCPSKTANVFLVLVQTETAVLL